MIKPVLFQGLIHQKSRLGVTMIELLCLTYPGQSIPLVLSLAAEFKSLDISNLQSTRKPGVSEESPFF